MGLVALSIQPLTWWFRLLILVFLPVVCVKSQNSMMLPTSNFPPPFCLYAHGVCLQPCWECLSVCSSVLCLMALPLLTEVIMCVISYFGSCCSIPDSSRWRNGCAEGHTAVASLGFLLFMRSLCFSSRLCSYLLSVALSGNCGCACVAVACTDVAFSSLFLSSLSLSGILSAKFLGRGIHVVRLGLAFVVAGLMSSGAEF